MFNRLGFQCTCCGAPLTGGEDTFGTIDQPMCQGCHFSLIEETEDQMWYGLAPHHHDLTLTGNLIGSTVLDPLPEPALDGRYWIESRGAWFQPDDEMDGKLGVWSTR